MNFASPEFQTALKILDLEKRPKAVVIKRSLHGLLKEVSATAAVQSQKFPW
jgi:hypothetical protein